MMEDLHLISKKNAHIYEKVLSDIEQVDVNHKCSWNSLINESYVLVERALHICYGLSKGWKDEKLHRISNKSSPQINQWDMYIVSVISISDRNSAQCEGEVSSLWAFPILQFHCFFCWYVTWAKIEKFLFGISSRRQQPQPGLQPSQGCFELLERGWPGPMYALPLPHVKVLAPSK